MSRKVIGEGSYGCVQQPSIPCETSPDTNFNYDEYRYITTPIDKMSQTDIIKKLVVSAHDKNQHQLFQVMKQVLKAMNFECNFPEVTCENQNGKTFWKPIKQ
jgi:hypothetical protein